MNQLIESQELPDQIVIPPDAVTLVHSDLTAFKTVVALLAERPANIDDVNDHNIRTMAKYRDALRAKLDIELAKDEQAYEHEIARFSGSTAKKGDLRERKPYFVQ